MSVVPDRRAGPVRGAAVQGDGGAGRGHDPDLVGAEAVTDHDLGAGHPRRHRVAVAAEGHQRLGGDGADHRELGRVGQRRRRAQRLGSGERGDGGLLPAAATAPVVEADAEFVQALLRPGDGRLVGQGAPPALRGGVVGLLDHALAVAVARWAEIDRDAVVLRGVRERRRHRPGRR